MVRLGEIISKKGLEREQPKIILTQCMTRNVNKNKYNTIKNPGTNSLPGLHVGFNITPYPSYHYAPFELSSYTHPPHPPPPPPVPPFSS